ncbi:uncharacterized protein [Bemisia tabaci]
MTSVVWVNSYHARKLALLVLSLFMCYEVFYFFHRGNGILEDRNKQLQEIEKQIAESYSPNRYDGQALKCQHPILDVDNPEMMKYMKYQPPIDCGPEKDWVEVNGSIARITDEAKEKHGDILCLFTDILRKSDDSVFAGWSTKTRTEHNFAGSDFVRADCEAQDAASWSSFLMGVRHDQDILDRIGWEHVPVDGLKLNVMIMGADSMSRLKMIRKLPKTYDKLKKMGAIILEGYNIIGDGTPQALIPILTGKTELQLPDTRKRMGSKASHVDVYPFIWKDFQKNGYVTTYFEDSSNVGTFTYRLKGFKEQPTDHYSRPYFIDATPFFNKYRKLCMAGKPRHLLLMDFPRNVFQVYRDKPKFVFSFLGEISHDSYNLVQAIDDDFVDWLRWFEDGNYLNNTLLIVMSDHGPRFAETRNTQQGKLEERLPFFSFIFPPWFEKMYPEAIKNFRYNVHSLTSPFDIHATLRDVLHFSGDGPGNISNRGISLFKKIPPERTCRDAFIEPHWCACLDWERLSVSSYVVKNIGELFVKHVNSYNAEFTDLCAKLTIKQIHWATKMVPNRSVMKFKGARDNDGFVPDLSDSVHVTMETYQLKVTTSPGDGIFEFSVNYDVNGNSYKLKMEDISRINEYGEQDGCIENTLHNLRKFCYCKDLL